MSSLEEITQLLEQVKNCPDADIKLYWEKVSALFFSLRSEDTLTCASGFCAWVEENAPPESLKYNYAAFLHANALIMREDFEKALPILTKARKCFEDAGDEDGVI